MNDLPLLDLFTRLREAGLPLGMEEYQLVLRAIESGFGLQDRAALARLCRTLWVKSADERGIFDYHFEQVMGSEAIFPTSQPSTRQSKQRKIFQITLCVVLGTLAFGTGLVVGSSLRQLYDDNTTTGSGSANPVIPKQSQKPTPTETGTSTQAPVPTETPQSNDNPILRTLIFWSLLAILLLAAGYVLVRWVAKLITQHYLGHSTSLPEARPSASTSALPSELIGKMEDEVQVAQVVRQGSVTGDEYFPVTRRQMKQIWRYLRRSVREGPPTELDIEATVNQIGRQGLLLEPILLPRRVNRAEMLLLIDQDGSMVPFHALSHRLAETALGGGRLGKAGIYYFHNCPVEYLYHDPNHQEAELVSDIVTHSCSPRTAILIFSDAGAARGGYSQERYELTKQLLAQLRQRVRYMAWLNPLPRSRWLGTTAGEIACLVPMFELSRRGLQDAIGVLRGRPTNFEGRRK
jgi:uncharacterized protein with von Willebrand factor type A (vWA) domain